MVDRAITTNSRDECLCAAKCILEMDPFQIKYIAMIIINVYLHSVLHVGHLQIYIEMYPAETPTEDGVSSWYMTLWGIIRVNFRKSKQQLGSSFVKRNIDNYLSTSS